MPNDHEQWLKAFGLRLRTERERQGLTRLALAEISHTEQGYIVQIERGERSPSLRTFLNLLSALGISADTLLFGINEEEINKKSQTINNIVGRLTKMSVEEITIFNSIIRLIVQYKDLTDT